MCSNRSCLCFISLLRLCSCSISYSQLKASHDQKITLFFLAEVSLVLRIDGDVRNPVCLTTLFRCCLLSALLLIHRHVEADIKANR